MLSSITLTQEAFFGRFGLPWVDEAYRFELSRLVVQTDAVLYRDLFTIYSPGQVWLPGAVMWVAGFEIYVFRLYMAFATLSIALLIYGILAESVGWRIAILSAFLYVFSWAPLLSGKADRLFFPLLFVYVSLRHFGRSTSPAVSLVLGVLAGLSGMMSQEMGVFAVISYLTLVCYLGTNHDASPPLDVGTVRRPIIRSLGYFAFGAAIIAVPVAVYFFLHSALDDAVRHLVLEAVDFSRAMDRPLLETAQLYRHADWELLELRNSPLTAAFFVYPAFLYATSIAVVVHRSAADQAGWTRSDRQLVWLVLFGALVYLIPLARSDFVHHWTGFVPVFIVTGVLVGSTSWDGIGVLRKKRTISIGIVVLLLLVGGLYGHGGNVRTLSQYDDGAYVDSELPMTNSLLIERRNHAIAFHVSNRIREVGADSDGAVFMPFNPQYYVYTGIRSPSGQLTYLPGEMEPDEVDRLIRVMRSDEIVVAYWRSRYIMTGDGPLTVADYHPRLHQHVVTECADLGTVHETSLYRC